jgi:hypothetical protein
LAASEYAKERTMVSRPTATAFTLITATVSAVLGDRTAAAARVLLTDRLLRKFHGLFDPPDAAASGGLALGVGEHALFPAGRASALAGVSATRMWVREA